MKRDDVHQAIGAAKKEAGRDERFVKLTIEHHQRSTGQGKKAKREEVASLSYKLDGKKLREAGRREGRYLLRTNMSHEEPAKLWEYYLQLTEVEPAFKELKHDLAVHPINHQLDHRIEAHIIISFLAYALQVTLKMRLKHCAKGLTPRSALEKFATMQMLDVHLIHSPPARSPLRGSLSAVYLAPLGYPPATGGRSSWRATRTRRKTCNSSLTSSSSDSPSRPRRASRGRRTTD